MAKRKSTTRRNAEPAEKPYPDADLIRLCCNLLAATGAFAGCTDGDPDGNNVHAEPIWSRIEARIERMIGIAAATKATTLAGLVSKAAAMTAIMKYESHCNLSDRSEAYVIAFASDVHNVCKQALEMEGALQRAHKFEIDRANALREQLKQWTPTPRAPL